MTQSPAPQVDRPLVPDGYGVPAEVEGTLSWAAVEDRLAAATHYWLATVRPDGRPHVVPRWGVWLDGRFWYDGAPTTLHARNVTARPACSLHLESGREAVIVDGASRPTRAAPGDLGARLSAAFGKYHDLGYDPGPDAWADEHGGGLRVLTPRTALAWFAFPGDATRFRFPGPPDPPPAAP